MCNNIIVLYIFMILKLFVLLILPLIIIIKRKKPYTKVLVIVDIILLLVLLVCNTFTLNKCVYNSTLSGVQRVKNENMINNYLEIHPTDIYRNELSAKEEYKTYSGRNLYYYNLNDSDLETYYYECGNKKVYLNEVGSSISALATAISTLYDKSVDPIEVFNYYKSDNKNICNKVITVDDIYSSVMQRYGAISLREISSVEIESVIKNDGLVIAELSAKEGSSLTCDSSYIVIYSIDFDGKYMISDATLKDKSYVCPYSSRAYGSVIDSELMNNSWSLEEINNEAIHYYMVKKG